MRNIWDKVQQYLKKQEEKIVKNQDSENAKPYDLIINPKKVQEIINLSYEDFLKKEIAIRFFNNMLGENIWLISHPSALDLVDGDGVVFYPDEIRELGRLKDKGLTNEDIKKIVLAKKILGGRLIDKIKIN